MAASFRRLPSALLLTAALLGSAAPFLGASGPNQEEVQRDPREAGELAAFLDSILPAQMERHHIPGAVVAVIRGGEVTALQGYGVTGGPGSRPVDPERTLFDLGSVGKLFTATAAMRLVRRGELALDDDVNLLLEGFQIPERFGAPITLRHLLTHTPGFDERFFLGMVAPDSDRIEPLQENLRRHLPPRISPPGTVFQYSNAGYTLAGHLLERVTGRSFYEVVRAELFQPLGMTRSTYSFPAEWVEDLAVGHENAPAPATPMAPWHLNQRPAGGLRSTATDMARFLQAHLSGWSPEEMFETRFTLHPALPGMTAGFMEHRWGGRRAFHHGGQWVGFSSLVYLLPDEGVGVFVAYNSGDGIHAQYELVEELLERWFPREAPLAPAAPAEWAPEWSASVPGVYRWNRRDRHTFLRLPSALMAHTVEVREDGPGVIRTVMVPPLVPERRWVAVADAEGVYREDGGEGLLAFTREGEGRAMQAHLAWPLLMTLDRRASHQDPGLHLTALLLLLGVLATTLIWPIGRGVRRVRGGGGEAPHPQALRRARRLAGWSAAVTLAFPPALLLFLAVDPPAFLQLPLYVKGLFLLPLGGSVLGILLLFSLPALRRDPAVPRGAYLHLVTVGTAWIFLVPLLLHWRLLGFHF